MTRHFGNGPPEMILEPGRGIAGDAGVIEVVLISRKSHDEVDILYGDAGYRLPLDLEVGDRIERLSAGAYTTTHASVRFNGFPPLEDYYI
ncbi:MAG: hypothetical protein V3R55_07685 [Alphaproteobacteria bacterium]